jgi:hypothetical protein
VPIRRWTTEPSWDSLGSEEVAREFPALSADAEWHHVSMGVVVRPTRADLPLADEQRREAQAAPGVAT